MEDIRSHFNAGILTLTLNRPEKRNALSSTMYQALADELLKVTLDSEVKAVCIEGSGGHFTAGNDLSQFAGVESRDELKATEQFMLALMDCPAPVVAKVEGMAIGIGTTMLLHCDFVYCAKNTMFSLPFVNLALVPEYASSKLLPEIVGPKKAAEWLMLGDTFGAEEALNAGLINGICEENDLESTCGQVLNKLVSKPKMAMRHTKALMKKNADEIKVRMNDELALFVPQLKSEAAREAFNAFLQKRKPDPARYR